ncbi:MAG: hypothetical protein JW731_05390 [Bacteroidales bacterium]|nr:hypothetical protein [Bacteroidales bacterium]
MKTLRFNFLVVFIAVALLQLHASGDEFTKTVNKSFDINKDAMLKVTNKFGKIQCTNWDKNVIAVDVTITVEASSQEKANRYFDKIRIEIEGGRDNVTATTELDDNVFDKMNNELSIDYLISMPKSVNIDLDNKFGDIILDEVSGNSNIDLSYGNIKCKRLTGSKNILEIKFSEGYIGYINDGELDLKYSELDIDEVNRLNAESKFSDFEIGKADVITLESGYDDDMIGSVRDLDIEASFSDVEVRRLDERLVVDFDYGELKVKEIGSEFSLVEIVNSFAGANIGFEPDASYRLVATVKMGDFNYPKEKARLSVVDLSFTSNKYEGVVGDDPNTSSKVLIDSKNSGVTLYYR